MSSSSPSSVDADVPSGRIRNGLHRSTWAVIFVTTICFFIANVPGQLVEVLEPNVDGKYGPHFDAFATHCEHGFPLTFLWRDPYEEVKGTWVTEDELSIWGLHEGVTRFNTSRLLIDVFVALFAIAGIGWLFEWRRRRRARLLQFSLRDLLVLLLACSVIAAWFGSALAEGQRERRVLAEITRARELDGDDRQSGEDSAEWQCGGSTWVRRLLGDRWLSWLDRVRSFDGGSNDLAYVAQLQHIKVVRIFAPSNNVQEFESLKALPQLEALDLMMIGYIPEGEDSETADVEPASNEALFKLVSQLRTLRGLNLYEGFVTNADLALISRLSDLEVLDVSDTEIDDRAIPYLLSLPRLRHLSLAGTRVTDAALPIIAQLKELEDLYLDSTEVTAEGLLQLRPLTKLKSFTYPDVPPETEKQIQESFPNLDRGYFGSL